MPHARRRIVFAFTVLATTAIAVASAFATNVVRFDSRVTISTRAPAFHGRVKSENDGCKPNRKVKLYKQRFGPDRLLGKDGTNSNGRWEIDVVPLKSGAYYAKVVRREEGAAGTIFVCRKDRSKTVVID